MGLGFMGHSRMAVFYVHGDGPTDFIRATNSRSDYIVLSYWSGVFRCTERALSWSETSKTLISRNLDFRARGLA